MWFLSGGSEIDNPAGKMIPCRVATCVGGVGIKLECDGESGDVAGGVRNIHASILVRAGAGRGCLIMVGEYG